MLRVMTLHARPGMELAMPVFHPASADRLLLRSGVALEDATIAKLRELRVRDLWIKYPRLEAVSEHVSAEIDAARSTVGSFIGEAFNAARRSAEADLDFLGYKRAIEDLIGKLLEFPRAALYLRDLADHDQPELRHAANVTFISILMGLKLEFYLIRERPKLPATVARDVSNLGVAAMLHDIGVVDLDPEVLQRWRTSRDTEDPDWREHVKLGYARVRGKVDPSAAAAVLHHHQHFDGTGFPRRTAFSGQRGALAGRQIHVFARIIAAAESLERLRNPAAGEPIPTVRALKMLGEEPLASRLDPLVYRGLLSVVPPYPPGSIVTLSNGFVGAVETWNCADPCRPAVRELGELDDPYCEDEGELINLRDHPSLCVAKIDGHDVRRDNFYPSKPGDFDLIATEKAMMNRAAPGGEELADASQRRAG